MSDTTEPLSRPPCVVKFGARRFDPFSAKTPWRKPADLGKLAGSIPFPEGGVAMRETKVDALARLVLRAIQSTARNVQAKTGRRRTACCSPNVSADRWPRRSNAKKRGCEGNRGCGHSHLTKAASFRDAAGRPTCHPREMRPSRFPRNTIPADRYPRAGAASTGR